MDSHGFLRVAAASPELRLADCAFNAQRTLALLARAEEQGVNVTVFPECGITGYTCNDLFHHLTLIEAGEQALLELASASASIYRGVVVVGLPLQVNGQLFNAAAVIHAGKILGMVPKSHLPNYKEFYDARYFSPAANARSSEVRIGGERIPFGTDLLFECHNFPGLTLAVEICEDLWMPVPPSSLAATHGATVFANLSASNDVIGKATYRRQLVTSQSGRCIGGYIYAASGIGESTTDMVFSGHSLIAENGVLLKEGERFCRESQLVVVDLDLDRLVHDRMQTNTFHDATRGSGLEGERYRRIAFDLQLSPRSPELLRDIDAAPFVPHQPATRDERCREIFQTQIAALARRLSAVGVPPLSIGVSGGLDSTLALLVACKTLDDLAVPRQRLRAFTLPGFGTSGRTRTNALALMRALGVQAQECDIRMLCLEQMKALGHSPFGIKLDHETLESLTEKLWQLSADNRNDLVFENIQARVRTSLLMNAGFVIGTGDLSELALGWCTYNADHMSMYNPNVSIPKTLVKFLVQWAAEHEFAGEAQETLLSIVETDISPELLPTDAKGQIVQRTETTIGPYELVDFFLYHFLRFGTRPEKIVFLAQHAKFSIVYSKAELQNWLRIFLKRFFASQFKRSCLPDGPKVGSVSLSPRGDWRMPSDATVTAWLSSLDDGLA